MGWMVSRGWESPRRESRRPCAAGPQLLLVDIRIGPDRPDLFPEGADPAVGSDGVQCEPQVAGEVSGHFVGRLRLQDDQGLQSVEGVVKEVGADLVQQHIALFPLQLLLQLLDGPLGFFQLQLPQPPA